MGWGRADVGGHRRDSGPRRARVAQLIVLASLVVAACGGGSGKATPPTTTATVAVRLTVDYRSTQFSPPFTLRLPDKRWTVAERDVDAAQIYVACKDCEHDGEENGEVTFDMALAERPPKEAIERLTGAANLRAGPVSAVTVGQARGYRFIGSRVGPGDVRFLDSGYRSEPRGAPIEVFAVQAAGRTVTIFVDPHTGTGAVLARFKAAAAAILRTVRFS